MGAGFFVQRDRGGVMKFVTISQTYFDMCQSDPELLFRENRRPHLLVMSLRYRGTVSSFAVPLRSNIPASAPKEQYFALPPRPSTRPGNHHGLHYIKMFPIQKSYQEKFWVGANTPFALYQEIISKHQKEIVDACQAYLDAYAAGLHPPFSVDIDAALERLSNAQATNYPNSLHGRG